jgi:hypothetical protein
MREDVCRKGTLDPGLTSAKKAITWREETVFPAPLSPDMTMLWFFPIIEKMNNKNREERKYE